MLIEEQRQALVAAEREVSALLRRAFDKASEGADFLTMEQAAPLVRRPVDVQPDESYPELGVRSFGHGTFHKPALDGTAVGTKKLYRIASRDLVFNIVFAWEGAVAIARDEDEGRVGSHRFLTCVPEPGGPSVVSFAVLPSRRLEGTAQKIGNCVARRSADRNRTLGLKKLAAIAVPVPSIEKQRWFDCMQAKVQALRKAHAEDLRRIGHAHPGHAAMKCSVGRPDARPRDRRRGHTRNEVRADKAHSDALRGRYQIAPSRYSASSRRAVSKA